MILFNQNDDYDRKQQLEYLNDLPQYKLFRLKSVPDQMKTYDFYNEKCIIEFKKRTCNHDTFPDFILQKDKFDTNLDIATRNNISFYYQISLKYKCQTFYIYLKNKGDGPNVSS